MKAMKTTSMTTHRRRYDGSRPSWKQFTDSVVSASVTAVGQTPSHPHHGLPSGIGECPIWRPKNSTSSATPVARKIPSRLAGVLMEHVREAGLVANA